MDNNTQILHSEKLRTIYFVFFYFHLSGLYRTFQLIFERNSLLKFSFKNMFNILNFMIPKFSFSRSHHEFARNDDIASIPWLNSPHLPGFWWHAGRRGCTFLCQHICGLCELYELWTGGGVGSLFVRHFSRVVLLLFDTEFMISMQWVLVSRVFSSKLYRLIDTSCLLKE